MFDSEIPLIAAPMAGGPSSLELAEAVGRAGGFPFLAAANLTPEAMAAQVERARTWGFAFGVNLFILHHLPNDRDAIEKYRAALQPQAEKYGVSLEQPPLDDDDQWPQKLDLLCHDPVPVVSFTFGIPASSDIRRLRRAGTTVLATVTTPEEAKAAEESGIDALVVQGPAAGGHSGTWDPHRSITSGTTTAAVHAVKEVTKLPLAAAGGVDSPGAVSKLRQAGADAVVVGTMLLRTDESGASELHKQALASPRFNDTAITRVFTGRPARGLRNSFVDTYEPSAVIGYPAVHHLTKELRRRALRAGDAEGAHFWAGTGFRSAATGPARETITRLAAGL